MPFFRDSFPPSRPIAAKGGIKAHSKRGAFATSWWGKRWLDVLETLNLGGRLARGRSYARKGQVLDITIDAGKVTAAVQGSERKPYRISIGVTQLAQKELERLGSELAKSPYYPAKLMAGEMPQDIETLFEAARVSLFPSRASELRTDCSCPDWSNPCKHIAAVYYLLGEEFDRDPFLIFRLRGVDVEALLGTPAVEITDEPIAIEDVRTLTRGDVPPELFWEGSRPEVDLTATPPQQPAPLLRRLGSPSFWRAERPLLETLEPVYGEASTAAMELLAKG